MPVKQRANSHTNGHRRGPGRPFEPGDRRINRRGRPRLAESLAEAIRQAGGEMVGSETRRDRVARRLWELAEAGNIQAAELVFNRGWGRVSDEEVLRRIEQLERLLGNGDTQTTT